MGPPLGGAGVGGVEDALGCQAVAAAVAEDVELAGLSRVTTRPRRHRSDPDRPSAPRMPPT